MTDWNFPLEALVRIKVAGQFLLSDRDFSTVHLARSHALHLHGYPGEMVLAGERITIAPGDLTLSPAGLPSMYDLPRPGRHWCIHFDTVREQGPSAPVSLHLSGCAHLRDKFAHVSWQFATACDGVGLYAAQAGLHELLLIAARRSNPWPQDDAAAVAAEYIDNHFDQPIGVKDIAAAAGRSQSYISRVFRKRFGTTVMRRLLQRRAEHAQFLLESSDLPIWRVAERCGVPDAQHFNKFIRSMLGASPSMLRRKTLKDIVDPDL